MCANKRAAQTHNEIDIVIKLPQLCYGMFYKIVFLW